MKPQFLYTGMKIFRVTIIMTALLVMMFGLFSTVSAQELAPIKSYGLKAVAGEAGIYQEKGQNDNIPQLVGNVLGSVLSLVSVLFFALMLYGGFMVMTARGDEEQVEDGKKTIFGAVAGIIVILSAYAITQFLFQSISGNYQPEKTVGGSPTQDQGSSSGGTLLGGAACTSTDECKLGGCVSGFCAPLPAGKKCTVKAECAGNACVKGVCVGGQLDGGKACGLNYHCKSNNCSSGLCTPLPGGKFCKENVDCQSNICISGVCTPKLLKKGEICKSNSNCLSGLCVQSSCKVDSHCPKNTFCKSDGNCSARVCD